jgi:hypothetical protein
VGWIKEALKRGELTVTDHMNCPFHNPERRPDIEPKFNACKKHR